MSDEKDADAAPLLLRLADLRRALSDALDAVEEQIGESIDLAQVPHFKGYYWCLNTDTAYAMDDDPGLRITAGQTDDDIATLAEMLADPRNARRCKPQHGTPRRATARTRIRRQPEAGQSTSDRPSAADI
jgi:hypothetical protein